jgi:hypothetical protein
MTLNLIDGYHIFLGSSVLIAGVGITGFSADRFLDAVSQIMLFRLVI